MPAYEPGNYVDHREMSRSWSSAHDWKSCIPQKGIESSNLSISAKPFEAAGHPGTYAVPRMAFFLQNIKKETGLTACKNWTGCV